MIIIILICKGKNPCLPTKSYAHITTVIYCYLVSLLNKVVAYIGIVATIVLLRHYCFGVKIPYNRASLMHDLGAV